MACLQNRTAALFELAAVHSSNPILQLLKTEGFGFGKKKHGTFFGRKIFR